MRRTFVQPSIRVWIVALFLVGAMLSGQIALQQWFDIGTTPIVQACQSHGSGC